MNQKWMKFAAIAAILLVAAAGLYAVLVPGYTPIDQWSGQLSAQQVEWAQFSVGYGVEEKSYDLPLEDAGELVAILGRITEENTDRTREHLGERNEYRLALHYEGKLWLFHCWDNGIVTLTFQDPETAALYGCQDANLCIHLPELWDYIMDTVDQFAA